jgi:hypothetical protein
MDVEKAIATEIEPKLNDVFGLSTTRALLTMATLAYVTNVGGKIQRYRAFVDSICTDDRVVREWGEAVAAKQAKEWKDLVPLEPETVGVLTPRAPR